MFYSASKAYEYICLILQRRIRKWQVYNSYQKIFPLLMADQEFNREDKIAIPGLKAIIKATLILFFGAISFIFFVARKWIFLMLAGLVLGLLVGYIYYSKKPSYYKVSMVVVFNELTKKTYAEILDQLDKLTTPESSERLARELKVSREVAQSILFIDAKNINNGSLRLDTSTKTRQPFKIILALTNNKSADSLQTGIVDYLNNSPYLKKFKEEQHRNFLDRISFIDRELAKLDSLKNEYTRFLSSSGKAANFYNNAFDPADIYVHSNELVNQKQTMLSAINVEGTAISVIDGFKITSSPQSASLLKYLLVFGGIGLAAGFILGFFLETKKKVTRG